MRRLLQKQTQSLQTAKVLAKAIRSDIPQSGLDPTYNQPTPQIIIQQSGYEQPSPIAPTAAVRSTVPGQKDPVTEELKRLDADVKRGLLDKTGDGANANIIKLGEQLKRVAEGIKNISGGGSRAGTREIQYDDERLSAIRMQGERYIPGMRESLGFGERGTFSGLKNLFSLSPLKDFKMEDIDERSLFGGAIKRKMAERQYATDQLAMAKTLKGDLRADVRKKKEYQDEDGQFSEKIFRQKKIEQFREQNRLRGEIGKTIEEIDRLKHDQGYTDEQIKKTGLYKTLQQQERELSAADPDRFARDVKEAKKKDIESQQANVKVAPLAPLAASVKSNDVAPDMSGMDVSEKESEQMLVVSQQIALLKQIEENTRPLKGLEVILKSAMGATGGGSGGDDNNGLDLSDLGRGPGRRGQPRGRGIGSKLKQLGKGAIGLGAKGARALTPIAAASVPLLAMKGVSDWAETASIQDESGDLTTTGEVLETAQTTVGGQGLKPIAEMSKLDQLESDTKTGWWDVFGSKKAQKKKQYEGLIERGQKFTPQEAEILKRNLGLDVSEHDIAKDSRSHTDSKFIQPSKMSGQYKIVTGDPVVPGLSLSQKQNRTFEKILINTNSIEPPQDMGGQVYQESDELKSAEKVFAQQSQPATNIVNAPTTNVSQTTNNITRPSARNTDSTYREYSKSRFAW
jgi:hypothetical protein